jgi:hypothetical protein
MAQLKPICACLMVLGALLPVGCGGSHSDSNNGAAIRSVTVSPAVASVKVGASQQFAATVAGSGKFSAAVTWTAALGTVDPVTGLYTATTGAGSDLVTATSVQDGSQSGQATVTVTASGTIGSVTVAPVLPTLGAGQSVQFTASVNGLGGISQLVQWTAVAGQITSSGLYTAPAASGNDIITVTSVQDLSVSAQVNVLVHAPTPAYAGTFLGAGTLILPRSGFTATLLLDGDVLLVGGTASGSTASAELFSLAMGDFKGTGTLDGRFAHSATLLPDGTVLIAGGALTTASGTASSTDAELYNPADGGFRPVGPMLSARAHHSATLLPNGLVLLAGGVDAAGNVLADAELYDPVAGSFTITKFMTTARAFHAATLLADGRVLVTGGEAVADGPALASAELYDPAHGTFTATAGSMAGARGGHAATLQPGGQVLVAGGMDSGLQSGSGNPLASAELYDPSAAAFTATGTMTMPRAYLDAAPLLDGRTLVVGGGSASAELYDPAGASFAATGAMAAAMTSGTETPLLDGSVLVSGGTTAARYQ